MLKLCKVLIISILIFTLILGVKIFIIDYQNPCCNQETVVILSKTNVNKLARKLKEQEVIKSIASFCWNVKIRRKVMQLKAGEYKFTPEDSIKSIIQKLITGQVVRHKIIISPGLTVREIKQILQKDSRLWGEITLPIAEGYIGPDTYCFHKNHSRDNLLQTMHDNFTQKVLKLWNNRQANLPFHSIEEALVLASIIEKETSVPEEKPLIAGVFCNRLRKNMLLQSCATVIYALKNSHKQFKLPLTKLHIKLKSPHNTYLYRGLPPTPICNFNLSSLHAALNPANTKFLFFVANGNGKHNFSYNCKQHNKNKKLFNVK